MRTIKLSVLLAVFLSAVAIAAPLPIPDSLRGGIDVDQSTIDFTLAMQNQG